MTHAVHVFVPGTPDDATRARYEATTRKLAGVTWRWHSAPGLSSASARYVERWRDSDGRYLPRMLRDTGTDGAATVSLVVYSAGYAAARSLLAHPDDRTMVDAFVALDAIHASYEGDGTPSDAQLAGFAAYAKRAKRDPHALMWVGHSDVKTHGYASTTETAAELVRLAGGTGGQFLVEAYDVAKADKAEHAAALTKWGPAFVGEALVPHLALRADEAAGALPWQDARLSLGERAVLFSLGELERGNLETWGRNAGERIELYMENALRRSDRTGEEQRVGITKGDWCIGGLSFAEQQALLPGESRVLPWRVAGWEVEEDAQRLGIWVPASALRDGSYVPQVGDVVVLNRPADAPVVPRGYRHGCRVSRAGDAAGAFQTVDANHGVAWGLIERTVHDVGLLGLAQMPRRASPLLDDLMAHIVQTSRDVWRGRYGLDYALRGLDVPGELVA